MAKRKYGNKKRRQCSLPPANPDPQGVRLLNLQLFAEGEDKTEQATPHRLREARKRGQVMKSMELNAAINMAGMAFFFLLFWPFFQNGIFAMLQHFLRTLPVEAAAGDLPIMLVMRLSLQHYMKLVLPFLLAAFFTGFIANVMQVGFLISTEAIKPQLNRLNPVEGFKRILSRRSLFELVKSVLKVVIFALVCYFYLRSQLQPMLLLLGQEPGVTARLLGKILVGLAFRVAAVFFMLALIDFIYQRHEYLKNLRMSRREIKDEYKQLEGDPHVRSRLRERQRAIARERSLARVPEATVVVTNPTELAVALRYNEKEDGAPLVLAKGAGVLARRIREIARDYRIPVITNPPVARLLYREVEIGGEIPVELYQAVAEILAMVYRLQEKERLRRRRAL
ncbi:MAG: flagellar biosynthesis protein FlhB [Bacillota bacterium]